LTFPDSTFRLSLVAGALAANGFGGADPPLADRWEWKLSRHSGAAVVPVSKAVRRRLGPAHLASKSTANTGG